MFYNTHQYIHISQTPWSFDCLEALDFDASFLEEDDHMHDQSIQALGVKLKGQLHQEKLNHFFGEVLKLGKFSIFFVFFGCLQQKHSRMLKKGVVDLNLGEV